jgi:hypothetical protein
LTNHNSIVIADAAPKTSPERAAGVDEVGVNGESPDTGGQQPQRGCGVATPRAAVAEEQEGYGHEFQDGRHAVRAESSMPAQRANSTYCPKAAKTVATPASAQTDRDSPVRRSHDSAMSMDGLAGCKAAGCGVRSIPKRFAG